MANFLGALVGGAQGGVAGAFASHPFDICSVAVMRGEARHGLAALIQRVRSEGPWGLWRGAPLNALFNAVNKSIYFMLYAWFTALYLRRSRAASVSSLANMAIGYCAQLGALPFFCPFYTTFLTSLKPDNVGKGGATIVSELYKEGGMARFYKGSSSWIAYALRPAIEITIYDQIRNALLSEPGATIGGAKAFLLGALGRAIGTAVVFPVTFAMKSVATGKYKTLTEAWATAIRERGVLALWSGLGPELPRGIAMNATMMATREVLAPYNARWFA
jgi:hypothetical protein